MTPNVKLIRNLWRTGLLSSLGRTSEDPESPASDTQIDTPSQAWRSRHGTGSGNGLFVVDATNKYIDFSEGGGELTATLTEDDYNGNTLAEEIEDQLNTAGALTYTVSYSETEAKFTISASGTFSLLWSTGTHAATDISALCGFNDGADDTGASTYTSDYRRIHYPFESFGWLDLGTVQEINFAALIGHNIPSTATVKLVGADDTSGTNSVERTLTWYGKKLFAFPTALSKSCFRFTIAAPDSSASYIEVGTPVIGKAWEFNRGLGKDFEWGPMDGSEVSFSDAMVAHAMKKPAPYVGVLPFVGLNDSARTQVLSLLAVEGIVHGFVVCFDSNNPNTTSWLIRNEEVSLPVYSNYGYWNWTAAVRELL